MRRPDAEQVADEADRVPCPTRTGQLGLLPSRPMGEDDQAAAGHLPWVEPEALHHHPPPS
jgi:hypothetical protein